MTTHTTDHTAARGEAQPQHTSTDDREEMDQEEAERERLRKAALSLALEEDRKRGWTHNPLGTFQPERH